MGAKLDHWCRVPELANLTDQQQKYISAPLELGAYSKCYMFDIDYSTYTHEELLDWDRESMVGNATDITYCKSGWSYDKSIFTSTAMSEVGYHLHSWFYPNWSLTLIWIMFYIPSQKQAPWLSDAYLYMIYQKTSIPGSRNWMSVVRC